VPTPRLNRWLPTSGRRRAVLFAVLAVAATAGAIVLIGEAAHFPALLRRLRRATPTWLIVCAGGELIAYAGYALSYQAIAGMAGGPQLPLPIVLRVIGLSFGAFSVATVAGGLSVDFWALREAGEPAVPASARVIALETLRWAVMGIATCAAAVVVLVGSADHPPWPVEAAWLALVPACFAGGLWISSPRRRDRFTETASHGRVRRALGVAVTSLVMIRQLASHPGAVRLRAIGGCAVFWLGDLVCAWAALRAFGVSLALAPLVLGYVTGYVSVGLPLPAGGSGSVDAAMTGGFVLAGAPLSAALLGAVAFRVFSFWLPALLAAGSVLTARGLRRRLHEVAEQRM
jgi:uncharacterized membrane protein YbhN (UPF0104 family)